MPRSAKWDLYGEITNDYDVDQLARSLIPDQEGRSAAGAAMHARSSARSSRRRVTPASGMSASSTTAGGRRHQGAENPVGGHTCAALPGRAQQSDVRFHPLGHQLRRGALEYIGRQNGAPLSVRNWVQSGKGRAVHSLPGGSDRRAALDDLRLDAARHLRDHESGGGRPALVVRGRRARCAWARSTG